jgi:hypothetical protein
VKKKREEREDKYELWMISVAAWGETNEKQLRNIKKRNENKRKKSLI